MTPEERFNQDVWWILQEIAGRKLATLEGKPTEFEVVKLIAAGIPSQDRQKNIIHKLQEWKAVKILNESPADWGGSGKHIFKLQLLVPKFTEIYKKFQKACDLTSYLNDYQERMVKGEDPPDFLHLKSTDDKRVAQASLRKKHKGQMFETGSGGGYYNRSHPIRPLKKQSANEIVDEFSPENYPFVLMVLKKIASLAEFSTDNEVHYKLQSPFGQEIIKERSLLKKFESQRLFKHLGEDGVFGIVTLGNLETKLIKEIVSRLEEREAGVITSDEFKVEDTKKKYDKIVQDLHEPNQLSEFKERYNKILGEIKSKSKNLDASPQKDTQTPISPSNDKVLECGSLKINLDQSTIQFNDTSPVEISTGVNTIKFLIILMENKRVVEYTEIAQKLKLNCYHDGVTNKDVAREVQFLRRDLGDSLVKIGMNKTEIQGMFISKKNVGYKLRCSN